MDTTVSPVAAYASPWCDCRHALDITALTGCLEREEKARSEETAAHAASAAALQADLAELQVRTRLLLIHDRQSILQRPSFRPGLH